MPGELETTSGCRPSRQDPFMVFYPPSLPPSGGMPSASPPFTLPQGREALPILCLDFDGVLHSYTSGWQGADVVSDPPVPGAMDFIVKMLVGFRVCIFSSRSHQPGGKQAMQAWIYDNLLAGGYSAIAAAVMAQLEWPDGKPAALVTIDDRAITFTGVWPSITDIATFKPWNKKGT